MSRKYERHGGHGTKMYFIWMSIRNRCLNPRNPAYKNYGGRGITICDQWSKFSNFLADMGTPLPNMTLERVDNNKGYSKENCIWADRTAQGRNKRNNVLITAFGETLPLSAWVERLGLNYGTTHRRIWKGWPPEEALTTPPLLPISFHRKGIKLLKGTRLYK